MKISVFVIALAAIACANALTIPKTQVKSQVPAPATAIAAFDLGYNGYILPQAHEFSHNHIQNFPDSAEGEALRNHFMFLEILLSGLANAMHKQQ
ncbi:hypothetical protein BGW39_009535 [Mortierella sp. 14UC]|nr:hypothetical protein BGW39_009535 [Mortierella sp. 14UC]